MKYSNREDRNIRNIVKNTSLYPSRRTIKSKYDVTRVVEEFANGLNGFDDNLVDKYYIPGHIPTRDIMTELGDTLGKPSTANKVSLFILVIAVFLLLRF